VDLVGATLKVERQYTLAGDKPALGPLKTRAARRVIPIPADLLARLKARYDGLLAEGYTPRALQGAFVFGLDKPLDINAPNHYLRRLVGRIREEHPDFPQVRIHDLRHTAASLLLARGVDVSLVAGRLGHGNASVTLSIYRHLLSEERQQGVLPLEDLLGGPRHRA
jgi:integrase